MSTYIEFQRLMIGSSEAGRPGARHIANAIVHPRSKDEMGWKNNLLTQVEKYHCFALAMHMGKINVARLLLTDDMCDALQHSRPECMLDYVPEIMTECIEYTHGMLNVPLPVCKCISTRELLLAPKGC
jgi:hypothetical protein